MKRKHKLPDWRHALDLLDETLKMLPKTKILCPRHAAPTKDYDTEYEYMKAQTDTSDDE
jgi:hypothetical protein